MMFLDTSGLFCIVNPQEPRHSQAVDHFAKAMYRITHDVVLAEFVALADIRRLPRNKAVSFVDDVVASTEIEVVWTDEVLYVEAIELLKRRADKTYSLCDALSFVIMRRRGITDALTTDRHFEQEGFRRLLG